MPQLEHIEAIEKRLWNEADTLRANTNYASNEYFLPVIGLIFLRHAYSRYLAVKGDIEVGLPSREGKALLTAFLRRSNLPKPSIETASPAALVTPCPQALGLSS